MESANLRAVERAIEHIEAHLGGKLDLDEVARPRILEIPRYRLLAGEA
ncbi:MAG: hypothetical protein ACLSVD_13430 [Eggerthellaceae bacterium]